MRAAIISKSVSQGATACHQHSKGHLGNKSCKNCVAEGFCFFREEAGWGEGSRERTNIQCTHGALKKYHCLCLTSPDSGLTDLEGGPGHSYFKST